jgi:hypothetical protein
VILTTTSFPRDREGEKERELLATLDFEERRDIGTILKQQLA